MPWDNVLYFLARYPAVPPVAQMRVATSTRWYYSLAHNQHLTKDAWHAIWRACVEMATATPPLLTTTELTFSGLVNRELAPEERRTVLVAPLEKWGFDEGYSVMGVLLRSNRLTSSELALLCGRRFSNEVDDLLVKMYPGEAAFQISMFPGYSSDRALEAIYRMPKNDRPPCEEISSVLLSMSVGSVQRGLRQFTTCLTDCEQ
jgi:hypothetical protein